MKILVIPGYLAARAELVHLNLIDADHLVERFDAVAADARAAIALATAVKRADLVIALLPAGPDSFAAIGMAIGLETPVIAWDEGCTFGLSAACCHPLVHQLRGDLSLPSNRAILANQAAVVVEEHRAGRLGRGAYGHAGAIASRLAGGPTA